tara:strand:+ start:9549 stop:9779 length:231 start_codon:yes stop_codon:yes gene_type:complete
LFLKEQDLRDGRLDSQRGFTLVELLAVMTTMGVLAGIVVPAVSGTKEASNEGEVRGKARLYCAGRGQRLFRRPELG